MDPLNLGLGRLDPSKNEYEYKFHKKRLIRVFINNPKNLDFSHVPYINIY